MRHTPNSGSKLVFSEGNENPKTKNLAIESKQRQDSKPEKPSSLPKINPTNDFDQELLLASRVASTYKFKRINAMKKREPVKEIMTKEVFSVQENQKLSTVLELFRKHKIRHLPVLNGKKISGIISRTDINRLTFGALFENQEGADEAVLEILSIPQVMTSKPRVVQQDDTVKSVAEIFASEEFHALPVVENEELRGIVTTTDVIRYMLDQY
jgi:CBS domain-containing protein